MEKKLFLYQVVIVLVLACAMFQFTSAVWGKDSKTPSGTTNKTPAKKPAARTAAPRRAANPAVSPSSFKPDMPFAEALNILRNSTIPPLNIVVLWRDLDRNADITRDTPIGMDGVKGVPLKTHLSLLLMSLSSGALADIGYVVDGNIIIIATKDSLPKKMVTRLYDISDLVAPPSMGGMMPGFGMMPFGNMMMPGGMMPYGAAGLLNGLAPYGTYGNGNTNYQNQPNTTQNNRNQTQRTSSN